MLTSCAAYANSFFSGFVWDDKVLVVQKQAFFSDHANAIRILISPDAPLGVITPYYRPLNTLSYMLDHYLWGLNPFWYHLENVLLHALVSTLFYLLLIKVFEDGKLAFFSALLFALHPVNTESVSWVAARNVLFCGVFSIASLFFLAKGGVRGAVFSFLAYFFALLSKEQAIVLPFFLLSFGLFQAEGKFKIRKTVLAAYFAVTAVYFAIRRLVLGAFVAKHGLSFSLSRFKLIAAVCFEHFRLMLFPYRLNAFYSQKMIFFSSFKGVIVAICLLLLLYFSLNKKSASPVRAGAQWILWGLLPVSNIVKIPSAPVAERYQYMIIFGFVLIIGYFLAWLQKKRALAGAAVVSAFMIAYGVQTFQRNLVWQNDTALYSSMVRSDPGNMLARVNLGVDYENEGRIDEAIQEFRTVLGIDPGHIAARVNLGMAYIRKGRVPDAIMELRTAVRLGPSIPQTHIALGIAYVKDGLLGDAAGQFKTVLNLSPGNTLASEYLASIEKRLGQ